MLKGIWLYHKRTSLERKLSKEVWIFEEVIQLLKEVCLIDKQNLMIIYTSFGWPSLINNIISWVSKDKISISLSSNEDAYTTTGSSGKQLLWMKKMLKKYNMWKDILTFSRTILLKLWRKINLRNWGVPLITAYVKVYINQFLCQNRKKSFSPLRPLWHEK